MHYVSSQVIEPASVRNSEYYVPDRIIRFTGVYCIHTVICNICNTYCVNNTCVPLLWCKNFFQKSLILALWVLVCNAYAFVVLSLNPDIRTFHADCILVGFYFHVWIMFLDSAQKKNTYLIS
jgi:hypothetical protein